MPVNPLGKDRLREKEVADGLDRKILYQLDLDCRQSSSEIAKKLRVGKNVVSYRIERLIAENVITGFYTVIDVTKLGFFGIRVYLKLHYLPPKKEGEILDYLIKQRITWWVGKIDGDYSVGVVAWVKNVKEFNDFWTGFSSKYHEFIVKSSVSIYNAVYDFSSGFLTGQEKNVSYVGEKKPVGLTKAEHKVLLVVSANARLPLVAIARDTGLAPLSVAKIIRRLKEKGVILAFRTKLNHALLGLTHYKINFYLKSLDRYAEMLSFAKAHPAVIYVDETIGFADFELELLADSHAHFNEMLAQFRAVFSEEIDDVNYFIYAETPKIKYYQE